MRYQELGLVERLRYEEDALDTEAADEIERLRAQVEARERILAAAYSEAAVLREALREIAFLDGPQSRGIPRRTSMGMLARKALGEEQPFEDRWDNA